MIKLNGVQIVPTIFPDGTSQVWKLPNDLIQYEHENKVEWEFDHEGEFMHLAQLKMLIDYDGEDASLHIPFLPYARQDKCVTNQTTFSLLTFSRLLNSLDFTNVSALDVHSPLAEVGIFNFTNIYPVKEINKVLNKLSNVTIAYPDKGAHHRYSINTMNSPIIGDKTRDQETGYITDYKVEGDPKDQDILIIDDICDGGMTFILFAKELLQRGAKSVNLYATHGIFSKGLGPLKEAGINRIFTSKGEVSEINTGISKQIVYKEI